MNLYLDTSSLVKLYILEPGSESVRSLVNRAAVVATSALAYPETRAALARRRRENALTAAGYRAASQAFEHDWGAFLSIDVSDGLCREAGDLAERHRLRAYDSVHLASFLAVLRRAAGDDIEFSSFDDRLSRAARAARRSRVRRGSPPGSERKSARSAKSDRGGGG